MGGELVTHTDLPSNRSGSKASMGAPHSSVSRLRRQMGTSTSVLAGTVTPHDSFCSTQGGGDIDWCVCGGVVLVIFGT